MNVSSISPQLKDMRCPVPLRPIKAWLMWRYEQMPGEPKARKVPYYTDGTPRRRHGTPDDKARLVSFEAAKAAAIRKGFDGIGFATLEDWGVTVVDYDDAAPEDVEHLNAGTYAEFSPSGNGVHAFFFGVLRNRKSHQSQGWPWGFETFSRNGFVTFTGNILPDAPLDTITRIPEAVLQVYRERFPEGPSAGDKAPSGPEGYSLDQVKAWLEVLDPDMAYDDWLTIGMALEADFGGDGLELWDEWSSAGSKYPGSEALEQKWRSFGQRGGVTIGSLKKLAAAAGAVVGGPVASVEEFEDLGIDAEDVKRAARFEVIPAGEFIKRPPPQWIIKDVLPKADLGVVFGESGSGKSFVMIDIAMAVARGVPWRGRKVQQGRVVYVAAEGGGGFRNRLKAYAHQHDIDLGKVDFGVIHAVPNLLEKIDIKDMVRAIGKADLVVFDTFAQVTAGANENSGEDMGLALANARAIGHATGAVVILVHHSGKDASKGARGWSGIRAAADFELEVLRLEEKRWIRTTKQKDGDDEAQWGFGLGQVEVGVDEDGEAITSCVILEADAPVQGRGAKVKERRFGPWEAAVLEALAEFELAEDRVHRAELTARVVAAKPDGDMPDWRARESIGRALTSLKKASVIGEVADHVYRRWD